MYSSKHDFTFEKLNITNTKKVEVPFFEPNSYKIKVKSFCLEMTETDVRRVIVFWKYKGTNTCTNCFFYYDEESKMEECFSAFNYRGIVRNVFADYANHTFKLTFIIENGFVYRIYYHIGKKEPLTVQRFTQNVDSSQRPINIFEEDIVLRNILGQKLGYIFENEIRLYTDDRFNDIKEPSLVHIKTIETNELLCCTSKFYITGYNTTKSPKGVFGFITNRTLCGFELRKWTDSEPLAHFSVAQSVINNVTFNEVKGLIACSDENGSYFYVMKYEANKGDVPKIHLQTTYYRGLTKAKIQQLFITEDGKILIAVSGRSVRAIPIPENSTGQFVDEKNIVTITFNKEMDISVCTLKQTENIYTFVISTEMGIYLALISLDAKPNVLMGEETKLEGMMYSREASTIIGEYKFYDDQDNKEKKYFAKF
ncbi:hypothetical protein EIN_092040 [Entamoeba invadens IP1]|uniref:Uncharacterized protein n=1 Tax=Entamoeba invadens IP1 TaxID=370355 RepID=A0A0A1TYR5_ENTIV|nr:hypothetical protein EIN_092040 [Entamoeba invadens IP1]ELP86639.1 hypothetical protein EIN_092040 [Entamoeba invadens IP1]|eukprot:XP_004185985.1 hypothetical protein EIN_092040 [Entamoeba invadens IP1]